MDALLPVFQWLDDIAISQFFLNNTWATPVIQCIHIIAVVVFIGAVLVVDIRLMGGGLTETPLRKLAATAEPFMIWAFIFLVISGWPQMASTSMKQYFSPFFWWKMEGILLAMILTLTVRRRLTRIDEASLGRFWPKMVGLTSMSLWTGVLVGARLIGLLS